MKKTAKAITAIILTLAFCLCMAGCGSDDSGDDGGVTGGTCTITVQDQIQEAEYEIDGETVLEVLQKTGLGIATKNEGTGTSVVAIEGVANGDKGKTSGWMFTVNGEIPMDYSDNIKVNDGDEIVWEFAEGM